ncbi:amidohydrolase [Coriobacterium glomerans PW2]|uniref:Amidohydrolase n=1 Tax=Coriobacterium glomerans (strain ATCC 49209 / DSM 20642 / JCM 10262 / PW2) TaxID=700015 RepID=F2N7E8_CORGP|nr:amidohydrolase family protein [Coriobacterium glomerans]AEB06764.1 amidohydrolase [Coriobacterium glomerans PW2]
MSTRKAGEDRPSLFINATVLDGTEHMHARPGTDVAVADGIICEVGPSGALRAPPGCRVIDLEGAFLLPGLINMHVHLCGSGKPVSARRAGRLMRRIDNPIGRAVLRRVMRSNAQTQLASGTTTLRGAGDPLMADIAVRDDIRSGRHMGPRIMAAGIGITAPGGHGAGLFAREARTQEQAASLVRELFACGTDVIKLFVTGGVFDAARVGEPGMVRMAPDVISTACATAHRLNLPVMAHIESTEGMRAGLEAGVDTIEHGAQMTPDLIDMLRSGSGAQLAGRSPSVTCTLSHALPSVLLPPERLQLTEAQRVNADIVCRGIIACARAALDAGIPVGLGTDASCPFVSHYDMWREVIYFSDYLDVTPRFALHTATQVNARLLGIDSQTGTIAAGKSADLIVVEQNPLENLNALRDPRLVMARGHLVRRHRLRHRAELERILDSIMTAPNGELKGGGNQEPR